MLITLKVIHKIFILCYLQNGSRGNVKDDDKNDEIVSFNFYFKLTYLVTCLLLY